MQERDLELEQWQRQWQADRAAPRDIKKMVDSGTRAMRRGVAIEIAVTIVMGGGSLIWAVSSRRADIAVLAIAVWVFIAIAWTAALLLYRGAWEPASASTTAFLEISILRTERRLLATVVQIVLYVVISTFDFVWIYYYLDRPAPWAFFSRPATLVFLFVVTPLFIAVIAWYRRRLTRELANLVALRRQLHEP
jgi:hypothetical protein